MRGDRNKDKNEEIKEKRKAIKANLKLKIPPRTLESFSHKLGDHDQTLNHKKVYRTLDDVRISKDKTIEENFDYYFEKIKKIGEGCHSVVFSCKDKSTGNLFAVKITRKRDLQHFQDIRESFVILKKLDHQNVLKANYLFMNQNLMTFHLVSELCEYQDLQFYMMKHKNIHQSEGAFILWELLATVAYLHQKGVCHRDLKPDNILYDPKNKKIKIIDFECAKMTHYIHQQHQMLTRTGAISYRAPQLFSPNFYDEKVDIWAIGVIGFQILSGKHPFLCEYEGQKIHKITETEPDYLMISPKARNLLKKLLTKNPKVRISAIEALHEEFFLVHSETPHLDKKHNCFKSLKSIPLDASIERKHKKSLDTDCTQQYQGDIDGDIGVLRCKKMTP